MNATLRSSAVRCVSALGFAGSAWVALTAWSPAMPQTAGEGAVTVSGYIQVAQVDVAPDEHLATYSTEQAERGRAEFEYSCADCHGIDLRGGLLGGPPLRGMSFESKFANGLPAGILFDVIRGTMPPDAPGRLPEDVYLEMMAFILEVNGFEAGEPLPSSSEALYELVLQK